MIRRMPTKRAIPFAVVLFSLFAAEPAAARLRCETLPKLLDSYTQAHIVHKRMTSELRARTVESYLRSLDPSKSIFLASEVAAIRKDSDRIFRETRGGNCGYLIDLQERVHGRYQLLEALVRGMVSRDDFALDPTIELVIDPEERGHPADDSARGELVRKLVHFQLSNLLASEEDEVEAKKRLIHRYELMTKRSSEVTDEDVYSNFVDAFARSLDPHSNYFSADAMEDFTIGMSLSLEGIGVALSSRDGYPVVEQIIPRRRDGPRQGARAERQDHRRRPGRRCGGGRGGHGAARRRAPDPRQEEQQGQAHGAPQEGEDRALQT